MKQLTLRFQAQDTWFFQEPLPGNSGFLKSLPLPPVRAFEGVVRALLRTVTGQPNTLAGGLRIAGPWPCWQQNTSLERLYPWPLHIVEQETSGQRALLRPAQDITHCDLGRVRLPTLPQSCRVDEAEGAAWKTPAGWLTRNDFLALLSNCHANVTPRTLPVTREARLGIARQGITKLTDEGKLYQTEHLRPDPELCFCITLRVSPLKNGQADSAGEAVLAQLAQHLGTGRLVRFGAEGRSAHVSVHDDKHASQLDAPILPSSFAGQNVALIATSAMDFDGNWLPKELKPEAGNSGQAQSWRGEFCAVGEKFQLRIISAVIGKRVVEGHAMRGTVKDTSREFKPGNVHLGQGARALVPAGSVWFGQLLHGDFARLARAKLGTGKKLGRGEFALATWKEGDA